MPRYDGNTRRKTKRGRKHSSRKGMGHDARRRLAKRKRSREGRKDGS